MKVVGIVAEYNPFHNGHHYQIQYAKEVLKADYVIVAMSGDFTQRGTIACFDKYTRTHAALLSGADIIYEIPAIFACASAKEFASAAVALLSATGVVDTILFGAETGIEDDFLFAAKKILELENDKDFNQEIASKVSNGQAYAKAYSESLSKFIEPAFLQSPNNILGLEYTLYIEKNNLPIDIAVLKRIANDYNQTNLSGKYSSASAIRNALSKNEDIKKIEEAIPNELIDLYASSVFIDENDISSLLHFTLLASDDFSSFADSNSDISDRINNLKKDFASYKSFVEQLKTKNLSYTRLSRILSHILLGIKQSDVDSAKAAGYIEYLRMLGFSKNGANLLSRIKEKTTLGQITNANEHMSEFDLKASDIMRIVKTEKTGISYPNEFTRKFTLKNI